MTAHISSICISYMVPILANHMCAQSAGPAYCADIQPAAHRSLDDDCVGELLERRMGRRAPHVTEDPVGQTQQELYAILLNTAHAVPVL